jgi:hypothetical protein
MKQELWYSNKRDLLAILTFHSCAVFIKYTEDENDNLLYNSNYAVLREVWDRYPEHRGLFYIGEFD